MMERFEKNFQREKQKMLLTSIFPSFFFFNTRVVREVRRILL